VSPNEPRWIQRLVIEAIHLDQNREHGGLHGLRDENALESALARPRQEWNYDSSVGVAELAAAYGFGLSSGHPFNDGNKRVAFLSIVVFLGINGYEFEAPEEEVVGAMRSLAAGRTTEEELSGWVRSRMRILFLLKRDH